ncbi:MAG: lysylphosphatidylglycerol synthase domain-containing protein [Bacteroidia bacterium]
MKKSGWLLLFKLALTILSLWIIYKQVIEKENFADVIRDAKQLANDNDALLLLIISLFLMVINWSIEAVKWKFLVSKIVAISFLQSLNAVLSGVTLSFFTPNRMGEFAGRILHLPYGTRIRATFATLIGNAAQLVITIGAGVASAGFIMNFIELDVRINLLIIAAIFIINIILLLIYFNISILDKWLLKIKLMHKYADHIHALSGYSKTELAKVLLLSFTRYFVFATQYVLILQMMNVDADLADLYFAVAAVFLIITVIPTIALTELTVRGSVAVSIISIVSNNKLGILEAAFIVWFINLVIPSVLGSFTLLTLKLARQK